MEIVIRVPFAAEPAVNDGSFEYALEEVVNNVLFQFEMFDVEVRVEWVR